MLTKILSCGGLSPQESAIDAKPIDTYLEQEHLKSRPHLKIKNTAFGKDFMVYGHVIPMLNSPTGHTLKGRIVRFHVFADRVVMLESPEGHSLGKNNESTILLADFPIVDTQNDGVVVDFAQGMKSAFTTRNVHARSVSDSALGTAEQFKAVPLSTSFVKSIDVHDDVLTISQIAQWRNEKSELLSAEFRYNFREYTPSPTFKKTTFGKNRWMQYFSTPPLIKPPTTQPFAYISKWDLEKPITFYISSNTPLHYRQAIKDGLLFWNHIFGHKILEVQELDNGLMAPHPRYNIVQWVPWDNEASAYADMVVDHLTGQTLQAQIYIRSGWVIQSAQKLHNQLSELLIAQPSTEIKALENELALPTWFDWQEPCLKSMGSMDALALFLSTADKQHISDELLTILIGDILRTVVAHEMGHVLGLRHNLAGNLSGTMSLAEHDSVLKSYLETGEFNRGHESYLSSSIMDVFSAADDALVGAQMRVLIHDDISNSKLAHMYAHDKMAIDVGYFGKPITKHLPFCTDEDIGTYLDCRRWDTGNKPLMFNTQRQSSLMTQIAIMLADTFMITLNPDRAGGPMTVNDIPLTNAVVLKVVEQYVKDLLAWFDDNARSVQIESLFTALGPHNRQEIIAARFKDMRDQLEPTGVGKSIFSLMPPFRAEQVHETVLAQRFLQQLTKRLKQSAWSLSEEDLLKSHEIAEGFFKKLNEDVINLVLQLLSKTQFDDPKLQLPIEEALGLIAQDIIFATNKTTDKKLPQFSYALKTRDGAAQILSPALGILPDWSFDNLNQIIHEFKQLMRQHGAVSGETVNLNTMQREQRQWMLEQNRIVNTLMNVRNSARPLH